MIRKDRNFCDFVFYFNDTLDRGFPTIPDFGKVFERKIISETNYLSHVYCR